MCNPFNCIKTFFFYLSKIPVSIGFAYRGTNELAPKEEELEVQIHSNDENKCETLHYRINSQNY